MIGKAAKWAKQRSLSGWCARLAGASISLWFTRGRDGAAAYSAGGNAGTVGGASSLLRGQTDLDSGVLVAVRYGASSPAFY